jgi:hypothetical protein
VHGVVSSPADARKATGNGGVYSVSSFNDPAYRYITMKQVQFEKSDQREWLYLPIKSIIVQ